jgi:hypothetical protein
MPFLSDALVGKSTVSITEVVDIRRGSPMSDFWIDRFRDSDRLRAAAEGGAWGKVKATGVDDPEIGGVATLGNAAGDTRGEGMMFGLMGNAGDGLGDMAGEARALLCIGSRGDDVTEELLTGLWICDGG